MQFFQSIGEQVVDGTLQVRPPLSKRVVEQIVDRTVPLVMKEIAGVGARSRSGAEAVEQSVEVMQEIWQEQVSGCVVEQIADVTVPPVMQINSLVPQTTEDIEDGVQHVHS